MSYCLHFYVLWCLCMIVFSSFSFPGVPSLTSPQLVVCSSTHLATHLLVLSITRAVLVLISISMFSLNIYTSKAADHYGTFMPLFWFPFGVPPDFFTQVLSSYCHNSFVLLWSFFGYIVEVPHIFQSSNLHISANIVFCFHLECEMSMWQKTPYKHVREHWHVL